MDNDFKYRRQWFTEKKENDPTPNEQEKEKMQLQIKHLENELASLKLLIKTKANTESNSDSEVNNVSLPAYNQSWSWIKKMAYAIQKIKMPLQINTITDALSNIDEYLKYKQNANQVLCMHLLRAVRTKRLYRIKIPGNGGYFYCLPEWMQNEKLQENYLKKILF